jgi:hypothetical protein
MVKEAGDVLGVAQNKDSSEDMALIFVGSVSVK